MGTHCGAGLRTTRQGAHDYMPRGRGQIDGIWIAARPPFLLAAPLPASRPLPVHRQRLELAEHTAP